MTTTLKKMTTVIEIAKHLQPLETLDKTLDSLATAWRRAIDKGVALGKFDRYRELNEIEIDFVLDWFKNKTDEPLASIASNLVTTVQPNFEERLRTTVEREKQKLIREHENTLSEMRAESEATIKDLQKQHESVLQQEIAKQVAIIEKREAEKAQLMQQAALGSGKADLLESFQKQLNEELKQKEITLKAEFQHDRQLWQTERLNLIEAQEKQKTGHLKELKNLTETHEVEKLSLVTEGAETVKQLSTKLTKLESEKAELEAKLTEKKPWWHVSPYDVVNIASNVFAFFGLINLYGAIGLVVSIILILTFTGIIQDLKKSHRTGWLGVIGVGGIELVYCYIHNVFFSDILKTKEHLGFDYHTIAIASAIIISGLSTYVAVMTRIRTTDDAEKKRIDDIDRQHKEANT